MTTKILLQDISAVHSSAREAVDHAIRTLTDLLEKPRFFIPKGDSKLYRELRRDMPYAIHQTELPDTQILVNRNYKPLGNNSKTGDDWVVYEDAKNGHVKLTAPQIALVVSPGCVRSLFEDGNTPWSGRRAASAYLERLKALRRHI